MEYALLGSVNIRSHLNTAYESNTQLYNDNEKRDRLVLQKKNRCVNYG